MRNFLLCTSLFLLNILQFSVCGAEGPSEVDTREAMRQASRYFHDTVATQGGYLWRYSSDLTLREGEKIATTTQIWVQPPGTPTVGLAYLAAYEATNEAIYLEYAGEAARSLVNGQLRSGGWRYHIEFDPQLRKNYEYRVDTLPVHPNGLANLSTLDDDNTTGALKLLMEVDKALAFKDVSIHEASLYGLNALIKAQYPNGGWGQRFTGPISRDETKYPIKKASYALDWVRSWPYPDNSGTGTFEYFYTINDMVMSNCISLLIDASKIYKNAAYLNSAKRGGDFLILAQMPDPQPAWAQQYDHQMHPAWARILEPPSIVSYESQFVIQILIRLYLATGEKKYLDPIPKALNYLRSSALPDGQLARFYELKTNKPLYVTPEYQLTHDDKHLLPSYGFKMKNQVVAIDRVYQKALASGPTPVSAPPPKLRMTPALQSQARVIVDSLDPQKRWLIDARLLTKKGRAPSTKVLDSKTFADNLVKLSQYLNAAKR